MATTHVAIGSMTVAQVQKVPRPNCDDATLDTGGAAMNRKSMLTIGIAAVWLAVLGGLAISAQDKVHRESAGRARVL